MLQESNKRISSDIGILIRISIDKQPEVKVVNCDQSLHVKKGSV